jgi:hypothetical protein
MIKFLFLSRLNISPSLKVLFFRKEVMLILFLQNIGKTIHRYPLVFDDHSYLYDDENGNNNNNDMTLEGIKL